jgi:hypothetical protein
MVPELETSAGLEHRQLLAGMGQLWAKMGMGKTTNAKLQINDQWPNMKANNGLK